MSEWKQRRFWTEAAATPTQDGTAWEVRLDGRPVRTPAKAPLLLPSEGMARAVAAEWAAQDKLVNPNSMPFTRSANSAIDKVTPQFDEVAALVAEYGGSDLLCYRAEAPDILAQRQAEAWDPLLDWAASGLGAPLGMTAGVMHVPQPANSLETLAARVRALTPFQLAAMHDLVALSGSLVIGLAVLHEVLPPEDLWLRSRVDELFQQEQWGEDEEATEMAEAKRRDFLHAHRFLRLSLPGEGAAA